MPIYEYTCEECSAQFEKFVRSMTGGVEVKCPECGGSHVKKGWSLFGMAAVGGGLGALASASASACDTGGT